MVRGFISAIGVGDLVKIDAIMNIEKVFIHHAIPIAASPFRLIYSIIWVAVSQEVEQVIYYIIRLVVQFLAVPACIPKYLWARY